MAAIFWFCYSVSFSFSFRSHRQETVCCNHADAMWYWPWKSAKTDFFIHLTWYFVWWRSVELIWIQWRSHWQIYIYSFDQYVHVECATKKNIIIAFNSYTAFHSDSSEWIKMFANVQKKSRINLCKWSDKECCSKNVTQATKAQ